VASSYDKYSSLLQDNFRIGLLKQFVVHRLLIIHLSLIPHSKESNNGGRLIQQQQASSLAPSTAHLLCICMAVPVRLFKYHPTGYIACLSLY